MKNMSGIQKKYLACMLFGLIFMIFPVVKAHAASLEYASLGNADDATGNIVIIYGGLGNKSYYICNVTSLACMEEGSSTPALPNVAPVPGPNPTLLSATAGVPRIGRRSISPDGRFVYYYQYANDKNPVRKFVLVDSLTTKLYSVSDTVGYWDLLTEENRIFSVSPDSKTLVYLDDRNGSPSLYQVDLTHLTKTSMKGVQITRNSYTVSDFLFYDPHTIFFVANRDDPLVWSLYKYDIVSGALQKVMSQVSYAQPMEEVAGNIVTLQMKGNAVVPAIYNPISQTTQYFTLPETPGIEDVNNPYQVFNYKSLTGTLLLPDVSSATSTHPLIIWLHGGPYRQISTTIHSYESYGVYDWALEQARENGAVVLKLDYHGSYGYGRAFGEALKAHAGLTDVSDVTGALAAVKKQLAKNYSISGTYLVGNSYGGYLALKTIVTHPGSYKGAFSINGVTDWPTLLTKIGNSIFNVYFNGLPKPSNASLYDTADIASHASALSSNQKIMLVQAQADATIDPNQAEFLYNVLNIDNKNVDILRIDGEDHVFSKPSSISTICSSLLDFVDLTPNSSTRCDFQ